MNNPYISFDQFVFRSPLFSFNIFTKYLTEISNSEERFKQLLTNKIIQEAIFIASPVLFEELLKYLEKGLSEKKEEERFKYSIMRYLSRMSTRCTPFGTFAGCSVGNINDHTLITLNKIHYHRRHTRLDMNYLCSLSQDIAKSQEIKHHINFYCNTSIYKLGNRLRYVEYFYKGTIRFHRISAVDYSEYLEKILKKASQGSKFRDLATQLVDEEISIHEASAFIDELISSQILVSELEPAVTGQEFLAQMLQLLHDIMKDSNENGFISDFYNRLKKINELLQEIDSNPIGGKFNIYSEIISEITKLKTKFDPKYLFQIDLIKPIHDAVLNETVVVEIRDAIEFLNKITFAPKDTLLSKFRETFYERYEEREMPLLQILDNESGIGYRQNGLNGDINPLVDDLLIPQQGSIVNNISWNWVQSVLLKKYIEAKTNNQCTIHLTDKDFEHLLARWDDLPTTISTICQIIRDDEKSREIFLKSIGGSSAANLLGRFGHVDKQIEEQVLSITRKEEELNPDVIFAEVVHLPESRTGNILLRPVFRSYEIPYLAKSAVEKTYQIELSDLMISLKKGRIVLRSKRLNKEIIPRLSSAHNYQYNAMPVYHFLCDMQLQNLRAGVGFYWGTIASEYSWLPRVKYKNVILSPARWIVKKEEIKNFIDLTDDLVLIESIKNWRQLLQMPKYVVLDDGDNELFVDMDNALSIRTLLSVVKKRPSFYLEEFLFNADHAIVKSEEGVFTNEFVLSFYKENKINN